MMRTGAFTRHANRITAAIVAWMVLAGCAAGQNSPETAERRAEPDRARLLMRDSFRLSNPIAEGETVEDRAALAMSIDAAAATLGYEGWRVRARCAKSLGQFVDDAPLATVGLERIRDDAVLLFRADLNPTGAGSAWVYAKAGLGETADVFEWAQQRCDQEPKLYRRYGATSIALREIIVQEGRYELLACLSGDLYRGSMWSLDRVESARLDEKDDDTPAIPPSQNKELDRRMRELVIAQSVAEEYAALLMLGHADQAAQVAERLLRVIDYPETRMMLAEHAIRAGAVGPEQAVWLRDARDRIREEHSKERWAIREIEIPNPGFDAAALDRLEESDDPAIRESAKALRERLSEMRGEHNEEPPY